MVSWIESQPTPVITVLVFSFCYALAAAIFGAAVLLSRRPVGDELKTLSPVTLTPLAVILGLLIAFLASRVWENANHAGSYVGQEASALSKAIRFADALPPEVRTKVRTAVKQHVDLVVAHDWPEMAAMRLNPRVEAAGLINAINGLLAFTPTQPNQQLAQRGAIDAIEQALEARRNRIRLSETEIAPIRWAVIFVMVTLVLMTTAVIHIGRPAAMATALFIFSTAAAACLVLLMVNDRPFAAGGVTITPEAFREIVID
ncbi:MAG: DUF4239 domain-containing protein [Rhodomicrobium sp.]